MSDLLGNLSFLKDVRLFLWDFDGCLCDSERYHYWAYAKAFAQFGHELKEDEYYPSFTHLGDGVLREIEKYQLQIDPSSIAELKAKFYWELIQNNPPGLFPSVAEILSLAHKSGKLLAVASNSPGYELEYLLGKAGVLPLFTKIQGKTPALRKKPHPDLFLSVLRELQVLPEETLVLEDTERGLEAAARAGCRALWLRTPFNASLSVTSPHVAALSHAEFLAVLQKLLS